MSSRVKHPRVFLTVGQLVLSLFLYRSVAHSNGQLTALRAEEKENLTKLEIIERKLESLQSRQSSVGNADSVISKTVLGVATENPTPTPLAIPTALGMIQVNSYPMIEKIIYDSPAQTQTVETAPPGTYMLYYKKEGGWYQVDPPTKVGSFGWIQQDNLSEVPYVAETPFLGAQ